jgi:hypothetical protein
MTQDWTTALAMSKIVAPSYPALRCTLRWLHTALVTHCAGYKLRWLQNVRDETQQNQVGDEKAADSAGRDAVFERDRSTEAVRLGTGRLRVRVGREVLGPLDTVPPTTACPIIPVGVPPGGDSVCDVCCDCHWISVASGLLRLL